MAFLVSPKAIPRYIERYGYTFSWKRLWNIGKVMGSMAVSWATKKPVVWGRPFMMMVEPTNFCNLKCPLCPSGNGEMTRERGHLGIDDFKRLMDDTGDHLVLLMLWNQGEPFINKDLLEMIDYARSKRIVTITSTNGHYVRTRQQAEAVVRSGLSEMIVSLDGVDQETYEAYRVGGKLQKVIDGTKLVAEAKRELKSKTPRINMQFIVFRHNQDDIAEAERLAGELEADQFLIKTAQVYSDDDAATFLPEDDLFRRYEEGEEAGTLQVKGQPAKGCKVLWYSSMVNWNGDVAPCCFDKNVDFGMGNALDDSGGEGSSFSAIWKDRAYMDFREKILDDRKSVDMCRNCSEGYRGMFSLVKELRG
jgi:MoaA/NifB/PqqE/SkfB family radical SAM enzyme